jgi:hypothetical protein
MQGTTMTDTTHNRAGVTVASLATKATTGSNLHYQPKFAN